MYEELMANSILAAVAAESAKRQGLKPVRARVSAGPQYSINEDRLYNLFKLASEGTPCQAVRLEIELRSFQNVSGQDDPLILEEVEFE